MAAAVCAPVRALVWDVDGTLAETEFDGHRPAFNQAFAEAGLPWHWDEDTYARLLATTGGKERIAAWWQAVDARAAAQPASAATVAALHARKTLLYKARVAAGGIALRPGVRRLLLDARACRVRLAIATTTTRANVDALLRATLGGLAEGLFEVVVAGDEVPRKKPDPQAHLLAVARLGLPAEQCVALEDSAAGVRAALAAGLPTVALRSCLSLVEGFAPADQARLLGDLDGLGSHDQPARGQVLGQPWQGLVDMAVLAAWRQLGRGRRPQPQPLFSV